MILRLLLVLGLSLLLQRTSLRADSLGQKTGAVSFVLRALPPPGPAARPLLSIGDEKDGQVIFWIQLDAQRAQVGCEFLGVDGGVVYSSPFEVHAGPVSVQVALGSLANTTPKFDSLWIVVEGQTRLTFDRPLSFLPNGVVIGRNKVGGSLVKGFWEGEIAEQSEVALATLRSNQDQRRTLALRGDGSWSPKEAARLILGISEKRAPREILVSYPTAEGFGALVLDSTGGGLRFEKIGPGGVSYKTEEITWAAGAQVELLLRPPGFSSEPQNRDDSIRQTLLSHYWTLVANGRQVFLLPKEGDPAVLRSWWFGQTPQKSSWAAFSGGFLRIENVTTEELFDSLQNAWRLPTEDGFDYRGRPVGYAMTVEIPFARAGEGWPLVTTGFTGVADIVHWVWTGPGRAKIGLDHWGVAADYGPEFSVGNDPLAIEVIMGSLVPPHAGLLYEKWKNRVRVKVNGEVRLDLSRELHAVDASTIRVGVNFPGGSTTQDHFYGLIQQVNALGLTALKE